MYLVYKNKDGYDIGSSPSLVHATDNDTETFKLASHMGYKVLKVKHPITHE